jgi:hypothetical protein
MLRYLNLCSEEFYLMKTGYLARAVWDIWTGELENTLRMPLYVSGWPELKDEFGAYSEFRRYVDTVQHAGVADSSGRVSSTR